MTIEPMGWCVGDELAQWVHLGGSMRKRIGVSSVFLLVAVVLLAWSREAQASPASADSRVMVESYYKIAPGKVSTSLGVVALSLAVSVAVSMLRPAKAKTLPERR